MNDPRTGTSKAGRGAADGGAPGQTDQSRLLAGTALAGAILASSCCVLPLALALLGLGGAWVASLRTLAPYKPLFLAGTALALGTGFWASYVRPQPRCAPGTLCARPRSRPLTRAAFFIAAGLALLAATADYWAPWFY